MLRQEEKKHTLKEDRDRKIQAMGQMDGQRQFKMPPDSLTHSLSSDSGAWLPTPEFEYKAKHFEDPRNNESSKENMPPLELAHIPFLNVEEKDFLDWTEKLLGTDN